MARVLAFDVGLKRIGIAATDSLQIIASAVTTTSPRELHTFLQDYLKKNEVETFVLGKPMQMNGSDSESMKLVVQVQEWLQKNYPDIEICLMDERLTSRMAQHALVQSGLKKKDRRQKGLLDSTAATLILQTFLETRNNGFI
ncbi:MAG: Holliday junction resolvase RuvX [Flavobacteriaceae bacterium]|nr:Holliday junction resolvase RuvX [Flavobacteriaceae bacterium]